MIPIIKIIQSSTTTGGPGKSYTSNRHIWINTRNEEHMYVHTFNGYTLAVTQKITSDKIHFCARKCTTHMHLNSLICCNILVSKHPADQIAFLDAEVIITYCSPASCVVHFNAALMCTSPVNESEHLVICPTYQAHILTVSTIMRPPTTMCAVCQCAGVCWAT